MMHAKVKDLIECYLLRHTGCAKTKYIMKALNPSFSPLAKLLTLESYGHFSLTPREEGEIGSIPYRAKTEGILAR